MIVQQIFTSLACAPGSLVPAVVIVLVIMGILSD